MALHTNWRMPSAAGGMRRSGSRQPAVAAAAAAAARAAVVAAAAVAATMARSRSRRSLRLAGRAGRTVWQPTPSLCTRWSLSRCASSVLVAQGWCAPLRTPGHARRPHPTKLPQSQLPHAQCLVASAQVIGVTANVLGDMASRPNWGLNELDFVFATLVVRIACATRSSRCLVLTGFSQDCSSLLSSAVCTLPWQCVLCAPPAQSCSMPPCMFRCFALLPRAPRVLPAAAGTSACRRKKVTSCNPFLFLHSHCTMYIPHAGGIHHQLCSGVSAGARAGSPRRCCGLEPG